MENENEIIEHCMAGNWDEFDQVYDHYLPKIYKYVYNRTRHKQTAEDLTSSIFLKVVQGLNTYKKDKSPFVAWVYRIARNSVIDSARSSKSTLGLDTATQIASKDNVEGGVNTLMELEAVKKGMANLSEQEREVLTMRVWDELSHNEIAEILNISSNSSKVTFSRALVTLKQTIIT